jgi:four helix bundle protein
MLNDEFLMMNEMKKENIILDKSFGFALKIIALYKEMANQKEFVLSKQLLRSGTSIGANVEEASAAVSKKDFAAKMSIASKEARESRYWLRLIKMSNIVTVPVDEHLKEVDDIVNILTAIVKTSQSS